MRAEFPAKSPMVGLNCARAIFMLALQNTVRTGRLQTRPKCLVPYLRSSDQLVAPPSCRRLCLGRGDFMPPSLLFLAGGGACSARPQPLREFLAGRNNMTRDPTNKSS